MKCAVIGAGLGGLSAAIRLAVSGHTVDVYEKNNNPGGKANSFVSAGFRFDTGPSLLTMPFVLEELFEFAGKKLKDYVDLKKLDILCKYFYPDGTVINAYSELEKFSKEIENNTNDSSGNVKKYLEYSAKIYELTADLFLFKSFTERSTFLNRKALNTLLNINKIDPFRTMHKANSSFFKDQKTIQLFDRYATYNGSNPYLAPATLNIIQHVEYNLGGYIPVKGIYSIVEAVYRLAEETGVSFIFNSEVNSINYSNNIVKGISFIKDGNKDSAEYDIIVSNSDTGYTYGTLLNDNSSAGAKKYSRQEPSSSALVFYWGVEGIFDDLEIHNILFSEDYKKEFDQLFNDKKCPEDPTIYIYISSKINSTDAPEGKSSCYVMINAPYDAGQDWEKETVTSKERILLKIEKVLGIELKNRILTEDILTPPKIEEMTVSKRGSLYGISSNNKMAAFLRQQNRSRKYKGLYFTGGSAHPGGGIPLVILSGKITADLINKYEK